MSIEANITKKCIFTSHIDFYNFIKFKDSLLENYVEFKIFKDHMFLYLNGCPCEIEENESSALEIYKDFDKISEVAFDEVKKIIGCSSIIFKLDDIILFEI